MKKNEMKEGDFLTVEYPGGREIEAEIVRLCCPACGAEFIGTMRQAGGFVSGHIAYHEFVNSMDLMVKDLGGL